MVAFVDEHRDEHGVEPMCEVLRIRCVDPTWLDRSPASRLPGWESQTYEVS
jgi:hypothetical protein